MKTPSPMTIIQKDNAKRLKVLAARRVPKIFEEPAETTIEDFINVLAQISDTTGLCSPGFFLPNLTVEYGLSRTSHT